MRMWDNPRLLNGIADLLLACAAAMLLFAAARLALQSAPLQLREVTVLGRLTHADREQIAIAAGNALEGRTFLMADLDQVRRSLERVPWVRRVEVRRLWPDRLEVALEEHVALARWGDAELVNTHGERFAAATSARLPVFGGPAGTETEVARRYRRFAALLAPISEAPQRVTLTSRHAWQLQLTSGLHLELGRDLPEESAERRLERFVTSFPKTLARLQRQYEYVDLRYPRGFALRVAGLDG
jgi:cell division protein FtsQ